MGISFLHLADTHLGARHAQNGAGDPYLAALRRTLAPARRGEVSLVLHAGDMFNRSRPPVRLVGEGSAALLEAAEGGAHVVVVAGNHERSVHPCRLLLTHPRVYFVEGPSALRLEIDGARVVVHGFPFMRRDPRGRFEAALLGAGWPRVRGDVDVLLCHQTLDGATVGPVGYTFRGGPDVIPRTWIPAELDYAALGHIHRYQVLSHPRNPRLPLAYPGATERTSRAERFEEKGHIRGELAPLWCKFVTRPS